MSAIKAGNVYVEIGADPRKLFAALNKANKALGNMGKGMSGMGSRMTAAGAAAAAPVGLAMRQFANFDDAIRMTAAVSGATGADLQKLNDTARQLGATTSFTAVQVASLMTELGRAGFKPDEINTMTAAVLDLARATGTDATLASGIMAATLRQFGMGAGEATRAADVLTKTANSTFNTVESLGEALKYAGPVAQSLGLSLEDTAAILGVLGNVGIQGSEAGTALRRLSVISAGAGEKLQELFGVSNTDAAGNLKPLVDILDEISTATASMPVAERTKKMAEAFGLLGITSANVLSKSAGGVRELADSLRNAQGTAAKAAKEMDAGLGGAIRITLSAIEGTALAIGDALALSLQTLVQSIGVVSGGLTEFIKNNKELALSVAKGVGLFMLAGGALMVLGSSIQVVSFGIGGLLKAMSGIAAIAKVFGLIAGVAGLIATPIGAVVAGIVALIAFGPMIAEKIGGPLSFVGDVFRSVQDTIGQVAAGFVTFFSDIGSLASTTFKGIYDAIAVGDLAGAMEVAWAGMEAIWLRGTQSLVNMWYTAIGEIKKLFVTVGSAWDTYVTKPISMFGVRVAEAGQERAILGAFDTTQGTFFDNESKKAARGRYKVAEDLLGSSSIESLTANKEKAKAIMASLQETVNAGMADGATAEQQKAAEAAAKEIAAYKDAIRLVQERFQQLGIKTPEQRQAAIDKAQAAIDAATKASVDANNASVADSQARLNAAARAKGDQRAYSDQFAALTKDIEGASSIGQLQDAQGQFDALSSNGKLSPAQIASMEDAFFEAQNRIQKANASMGGVSPAILAAQAGAERAGLESQQSKADVVGTFSSVGLGGMGFGTSIAQKQLDMLGKIERNTQGIGDDGVIE